MTTNDTERPADAGRDFASAVFDTANVLLVVLDREGRMIRFNPACERVSGYSFAEVEGRFYWDFPVAPEDAELVRSHLGRIQAGESPDQGENGWITKDGQRRRISWAHTPILDEKGVVAYVVCTGIDISRQRVADEALRESEERFRTAFDFAPFGMSLTAMDGRWLKVNRALCEMLGYSEEELLAMTFQGITHPDDLELSLTVLHQLVAGEQRSCQMDKRYLHKLGHEISVLVSVSLVRDAAGRPAYFIAQVLDVTDRKRADETLQETTEMLRQLVHASPAAIIGFDGDGTVVRWNPAAERILGWSEAEVLGRFPPFVDDAKRAEFLDYLGRAMRGESWTNLEIRRRRRDGTQIELSASSGPLRNGTGEIVGMISVVSDFTERRQLEEQLFQAQRLESIGRLAGGVAHDFNNLLTAISGYTEFLLAELGGNDPRRRDAVEIARAAERAAALVKKLLAFSRKQVLQPRVVNLNSMLAELEPMLRQLIGEDVLLVVELARELGNVNADPAQIEQMIVNLAVNSRDAMPAGGMLTIESANVELTEGRAARLGVSPGRYVMLRVADDGIGMDEETRSRAFEPFFTTKAPGKGTGLGLATAYGLLNQSGGAIEVDSEPGLGTTFQIHLPQVDAGPERSEPPSIEAPVRAGSETVLLVEDEEAVRNLAHRVLLESGYTVLAAAGGWEAMEIAGRHPGTIHLLLTDVVMPGMGGRELADRLASERPEMRVLYMSGYTEEAVLQRGVTERGAAYVGKPFTPDTLRRTVCAALELGTTARAAG